MAATTMPRSTRLGVLAGLAFPVLFVASVVASSPPADNASNTQWITNYTGHGHQAQHLATGLLLVLAGLALMVFFTALWRRIADHRLEPISPLPLVAAGVSASCIAAGGVLMAVISASELAGSYPLPGADVLRLTNDLGFGLVGVGGMWAAATAVAVISVQGYAAGVFGRRMMIFGGAVAVILLPSIFFVPIIGLIIWTAAVAVSWLGSGAVRGPRVGESHDTTISATL